MRGTRVALAALTIASIGFLGSCSAPEPEPDEKPKAAKPVVYPVPDGCPTGEQFSQVNVGEKGWAEQIDSSLLNAALSTPLLEGGCSYLVGDVGATTDGEPIRRVIVAYFNMDTPNRHTRRELIRWAESAGATAVEEEISRTEFALPTEFSGLTEGTFIWTDGEASYQYLEEEGKETIPEFTQGSNAQIEFYVLADKMDAIKAAGEAGIDPTDPTKALAAGLPMVTSTTFNGTDPDGYTATYTAKVELQPFTTDVTNSAPGQQEILSTGTFTGSVKNTTPQRKSTPASFGAYVVYRGDSAACDQWNNIAVTGGDWSSRPYCVITSNGVGGVDLEPDGSHDFEPLAMSIKRGGFPEGGPELADFQSPVAVYAYLDPEFGVHWSEWTADRGCLTNRGTTEVWVLPMDGWPDPICAP